MRQRIKKFMAAVLTAAMTVTMLPASPANAVGSEAEIGTTQTITCSKFVTAGSPSEKQGTDDAKSVLVGTSAPNTAGSEAAAATIAGETAVGSNKIGSSRVAAVGFELPGDGVSDGQGAIEPETITQAVVTMTVFDGNDTLNKDKKTKAALFQVDAGQYENLASDGTINAPGATFPAKNGYTKEQTVFSNEWITYNDYQAQDLKLTFDVTDWVKEAIENGDTYAVFRLQTVISGFFVYREGKAAPTLSITTMTKEQYLLSIAEQIPLLQQTDNGIVVEQKKLNLPQKFMGASIVWESDKENVISKEGQVTIPAQNEKVTLTANLTLDSDTSVKQTKTFEITVLSAAEGLAHTAEQLQIPYVLDNGITLPVQAGGAAISWQGSEAVKSNGTIAADFDGKQKVTLKATLSKDGKTAEKTFEGYLLGKDAVYVQAYTRTPQGDYGNNLSRCMFLAYSENRKDQFTALHDDYGILFMRAESGTDQKLTAKGLKDPYLFYTKEGKYAVVAVRTEINGETDSSKASSVMFYSSEDLMAYEEIGFIDLNTDKAVCEPVCEYDSVLDGYRITWNDGTGNYYQNTLKTLSADSKASQPVSVSEALVRTADTGLSGTVQGNLLPLENEKGTKLKTKLSKLVNTGVQVPKSVTASQAQDVEKIKATVLYNDGSTAEKNVTWDLSAIDFSKPGTYTVNGMVTQPTFNNSKPLFQARPDPEMVKYNGKFYFISTDENGQGRIYIRESNTLEGIKNSSETLLLDGKSYPQLFTACLWAPELHVIEGQLYLFFSGSMSNWAGVQSFVMKLKEDGNPMETSGWETPIRVLDQNGKNLYDADTQGITLDMTYFQVDNQGYVVWAQRQRKPVDTGSWLYIAKVDKTKPWQLTSDRVCISKPDYGWDNNTTFVDEGPFVIQRNGKIYLTFSGAGVNPSYCVGIITASASEDLLNAASWRKGNYPILTSWSVTGQYGTGHNSYVYDDDGTLYNVYHAQWNKGQRSASIRRVHFDIDGDPVLDLVEERDLLEKYKAVTMQVEVTENSGGNVVKPDVKDDGKGGYEVTIPDFTPGQDKIVTIPLPGSLADSIKNSQEAQVSINVKLPEGLADDKVEAITIPKEVLSAAKEAGKDLAVAVNGSTSYQWTFSAKDLAGTEVSDLNLALEVDSEKDAEIKNLLGKDDTGMVLSFAQQGDIKGAKVIVDAAKMGWKAGETVTLSYYNPETKKLDTAGTYTVDKDGKVAIAPAKGGKYVLWKKAVSGTTIPVEKVTLNKTKLTLNVKKTYQLKATVTPNNATNREVTWTSDNKSVTTVTANGLVTAKKAGKAKITAKAGGKSVTCNVTVKVPVSKVTLNKTKLTMGVKESFTLKATVKPKNATNKKVSWKTSSKKIVTVKNGKLTAKKKGKATITATVDGKKVTCKVTVKPAPTKKTKVTLNKKKVSLKVKKTFQIKPKVSSKFGSATFKYTIDKKGKKAVKVDKNGKVTAKKKGKAAITVKTYNGKAKATLKVTVK